MGNFKKIKCYEIVFVLDVIQDVIQNLV